MSKQYNFWFYVNWNQFVHYFSPFLLQSSDKSYRRQELQKTSGTEGKSYGRQEVQKGRAIEDHQKFAERTWIIFTLLSILKLILNILDSGVQFLKPPFYCSLISNSFSKNQFFLLALCGNLNSDKILYLFHRQDIFKGEKTKVIMNRPAEKWCTTVNIK